MILRRLQSLLGRLYDLDVPITRQLAASANRVVDANKKRNKKS